MNWALVDTGTFDYAADAWGYTYGAAAEWYQGDWTLRGGVFDLSIVPNSADLDPNFGQFQWVGEIERRYDLLGHARQARSHRVLEPRPHGHLRGRDRARADDRRSRRHRRGPPISQPSGGVSLNLEQEITADLGVFARAGWADGDVEPYEFTDIDRTVAAGLSLKGNAMGQA